MWLPLVQRELKVALLRRKFHKQWMFAAWSAGGITLAALFLLSLTSNRSSGRNLFQWLFLLALFVIVSRGFALTADLFSEERRNGTLSLLVLTGLRPWEIFIHKLLGAVLLTAYCLLGGLPFFTMPFLTGGVPASQLICAFVCLTNGLIFCVSFGLLGSVIHRDGGQAQFVAHGLAVALCAITPVLYRFSSSVHLTATWANLLALSPAYPAYLVYRGGFAGVPLHLFWLGSAITLMYSAVVLLTTVVILHYSWRDRLNVYPQFGWRARLRDWIRGDHNWHARLRERFLADQPFCWLAARDHAPVFFAYTVIGVCIGIWLLGLSLFGSHWLSRGNSFVSSIVLHQVMNFVMAYAAGRRLGEERLTGSFEVLLTAPLCAEDLVEGQGKALLVQFRGVALLVLLMDVIFAGTGYLLLPPFGFVRLTYILAWVAILACWYSFHFEAASRAMWISTWTGRPAYAAMKACGNQWGLLVWVWLFSQGHVGNLFGLPMVVILAFTFFSTFGRRHRERLKLTSELRLIAAAPIPDPNDKRFKSWNPDKIFPPGQFGKLVWDPSQPRRRMDALNG